MIVLCYILLFYQKSLQEHHDLISRKLKKRGILSWNEEKSKIIWTWIWQILKLFFESNRLLLCYFSKEINHRRINLTPLIFLRFFFLDILQNFSSSIARNSHIDMKDKKSDQRQSNQPNNDWTNDNNHSLIHLIPTILHWKHHNIDKEHNNSQNNVR